MSKFIICRCSICCCSHQPLSPIKATNTPWEFMNHRPIRELWCILHEESVCSWRRGPLSRETWRKTSEFGRPQCLAPFHIFLETPKTAKSLCFKNPPPMRGPSVFLTGLRPHFAGCISGEVLGKWPHTIRPRLGSIGRE